MHMNTSTPCRSEWADEFAEAGLDEFRFHYLDLEAEQDRETITACSAAGIFTGVELP